MNKNQDFDPRYLLVLFALAFVLYYGCYGFAFLLFWCCLIGAVGFVLALGLDVYAELRRSCFKKRTDNH